MTLSLVDLGRPGRPMRGNCVGHDLKIVSLIEAPRPQSFLIEMAAVLAVSIVSCAVTEASRTCCEATPRSRSCGPVAVVVAGPPL